MAEIESTGSAAPSTDTTAASAAASPSSAPEPSPSPAAGSAGDTAVATDARSVWNEMQQSAKSEGTPPDAPQDPSLAQPATQADGRSEAPGSLPTRGPIPIDRHQAVVTNTRRKTLAEYGIEESVQADGSIARNITPDRVRNSLALATLVERDPKLAIRMIQAHLGEEATAAPSPPAEKPVDDPEPEPDIPLADGRATYTAERWRELRQWERREQQREAKREQDDWNRMAARQTTEAQNLIAHATQTWEGFAELKGDIYKLLERIPKEQFTQTTLHDAYITARNRAIKAQRQQWEAERSGQLTRKAAASTVQPGAPRPSTPRPDSELSSREIVMQEYRRHAAG